MTNTAGGGPFTLAERWRIDEIYVRAERGAWIWTIFWSVIRRIPTRHLECSAMQISVSEAKGQLTELVRRAEAGESMPRHSVNSSRVIVSVP